MEKPIIELKGIDIHLKLSDETPAYTAKLIVDGKYIADLENQGHGGCDMIHPVESFDFHELEARIAATYPRLWLEDKLPIEETLECLCHGLVWDHVDRRNLRSTLSRKVMVLRDGKLFTVSGKKSDAMIADLKAQMPSATILNCLKFDEAWKLYKEHAA